MRELYFAIHQKANFERLIFTCLAEAILKEKGTFHNNRFKLKNNSLLPNFEKQILRKICIDQTSKIHTPDLIKWKEYLLDDCVQKKYLFKFFGYYFKTPKFKKEIKNNLSDGFNKSIIAFVNTGKIEYLDCIYPKLDSIRIPDFKIFVRYKDQLESVEEVIRKGYFTGLG
jgi:hypothetical protein